MFEVLPVHWLALGVALALLEIFIPSFVMLISGCAAIIVAMISWVLPIGLSAQIFLWIVASILLSVAWFKYIKPLQKNKTKTGLGADTIIGETGMIVSEPIQDKQAVVRFSVPLLGSDEWNCRSDDELPSGARVRVTKILGNELFVELTEHQ